MILEGFSFDLKFLGYLNIWKTNWITFSENTFLEREIQTFHVGNSGMPCINLFKALFLLAWSSPTNEVQIYKCGEGGSVKSQCPHKELCKGNGWGLHLSLLLLWTASWFLPKRQSLTLCNPSRVTSFHPSQEIRAAAHPQLSAETLWSRLKTPEGFQSSQLSKMDVSICIPGSCSVRLLADSGYTWFAFPYAWFAFPSSFSNLESWRRKEVFFLSPTAYSYSYLLTFSRGRSSAFVPIKAPSRFCGEGEDPSLCIRIFKLVFWIHFQGSLPPFLGYIP